ncbi:uncharacterized protein SOCE26_017800 [Sorangium cellulosum]|uniref:Uncharacterized protein n=1 Tax=Sorangium cellulosum TaxID=56 RepID=A0A2L0EM73_SORCE|nr:uncharacterized protein SOCE26_017800 [Sorangium cellulosum]
MLDGARLVIRELPSGNIARGHYAVHLPRGAL